MARIIATALSAVTIVGLGIYALSYRQQELADAGLSNNSAEAFNLTTAVSRDVMTILGSAIPLLAAAVVVVFFLLLLITGR